LIIKRIFFWRLNDKCDSVQPFIRSGAPFVAGLSNTINVVFRFFIDYNKQPSKEFIFLFVAALVISSNHSLTELMIPVKELEEQIEGRLQWEPTSQSISLPFRSSESQSIADGGSMEDGAIQSYETFMTSMQTVLQELRSGEIL